MQSSESEAVRTAVGKALVGFARKAAGNGTLLVEQRIAVPLDPPVRVFGRPVGGAHLVQRVRVVRFAMIDGTLHEEGAVLADYGVRIQRIGPRGIEFRPLDTSPQSR